MAHLPPVRRRDLTLFVATRIGASERVRLRALACHWVGVVRSVLSGISTRSSRRDATTGSSTMCRPRTRAWCRSPGSSGESGNGARSRLSLSPWHALSTPMRAGAWNGPSRFAGRISTSSASGPSLPPPQHLSLPFGLNFPRTRRRACGISPSDPRPRREVRRRTRHGSGRTCRRASHAFPRICIREARAAS